MGGQTVLAATHINAEWTQEMSDVLEVIPVSALDGEIGDYAVLDGIYDHIGKYVTYPDTRRDRYRSAFRTSPDPIDNCTFAYHANGDYTTHPEKEGSKWVEEISKLYLDYTSQWAPIWDTDQPTVDEEQCTSQETQKYVVGGILVEPLVTSSSRQAAEHVRKELDALVDRVNYVLDFEQLCSDGKITEENRSFSSPINFPGVGEKTTQTLVGEFAVYSNILGVEKSYIDQTISTAFGNSADGDEIRSVVETCTEQYCEEYKNGTTTTTIHPEDLVGFPYLQPSSTIRKQTHTPHTPPEIAIEEILKYSC